MPATSQTVRTSDAQRPAESTSPPAFARRSAERLQPLPGIAGSVLCALSSRLLDLNAEIVAGHLRVERSAAHERAFVDLVLAVMLRVDRTAGFIADAEEDDGARNAVDEVREVLAAHRRGNFHRRVGLHGLLGGFSDEVAECLVVHRNRNEALVLELRVAAHGLAGRAGNALELFGEALLNFRLEGAGRAFELGVARNDVPARAGRHLAHRHDGRIDRRRFAAHHGLQVLHDGRSHHRGVAGSLRLSAVAVAAEDFDFKMVAGGKGRAVADADMAGIDVPPDMHAEGGINAIQSAVGDHVVGTRAELFSRLEAENDAALELVLDVVEHVGGRQQHRNMAVMTAGMHEARRARCVLGTGRFIDGQRVNVRAQQNRLARRLALDDGERARLRAGAPLHADLVKLFADAGSGVHFPIARFRMLMEIAAHLNLIAVVLLLKFLNGHSSAPILMRGGWLKRVCGSVAGGNSACRQGLARRSRRGIRSDAAL